MRAVKNIYCLLIDEAMRRFYLTGERIPVEQQNEKQFDKNLECRAINIERRKRRSLVIVKK